MLGEPGGEELRDHAQPGLRDAVVAPVDAGERARDRGDEDDLGVATRPGGDQLDHRAGHGLGEEERARGG